MEAAKDTSIVTGFMPIREGLDKAGVDTLVIFDTHWFTTAEHVIAGADHFCGVYTSVASTPLRNCRH